MTQGYSGSFAINGINLILQPTSGRWMSRDALGIDGLGHTIYPSIREFELTWGIMSTDELKQLIDAQLSVSNTGTVVCDLPKWGDSGYLFYGYSGCTLREPDAGTYFSDGWVQNIKLIITNVRTN